MPPRGPRPDWNHPPMHQGFQGNSGPPNRVPGPMMQGPPRGPPPSQLGMQSDLFNLKKKSYAQC